MKGNGCGPESWPNWIKESLFNWFFEASCNKHDIGYTKGGNEARRKVCDDKFLEAMLRDSKRVNIFARPAAYITAYTFYAIVRHSPKAKKQFNYTD